MQQIAVYECDNCGSDIRPEDLTGKSDDTFETGCCGVLYVFNPLESENTEIKDEEESSEDKDSVIVEEDNSMQDQEDEAEEKQASIEDSDVFFSEDGADDEEDEDLLWS